MAAPRILLSWSSGKDCAWALHELRARGEFEVAGLLTTLEAGAERVSMHGVPRALLRAQARAVGLPLWELAVPRPCSDAQYAALMTDTLSRARAEGIEAVAFGDLFLEDVRAYREAKMAGTGLGCVFPLWGRDTGELAREMLAGGLAARLVSVDTAQLDARFAGRAFDSAFLDELPPGVDPCGERGEFHTFVHAGPMLRAPLAVRVGATSVRDGFAHADPTAI